MALRGSVIVAGMVLLAASDFVAAAEPGFYMAGALGQAQHDPGKSGGMVIAIRRFVDFSDFAVQIYPDAVDVDTDERSWNAALGYRVNDYFAAELTYMDFGRATVSERYDTTNFGFPFPTRITREFITDVAGPAVSVLGSLPLGAHVDVYVRAGYLFADEKIEQHYLGGSQSMTFGSEVWLGGVGADWSFAQRWAARVEYLRTGTLDANLIAGDNQLDQVTVGVLFRL